MTAPDLRLAIPAAVVWLAVALAIGTPSAAVATAAAGWCLAGALLAAGRRTPRRGMAIAALAIGLAALGVTAVAVAAPHRQPVALLDAARASRFVQVEATTTQTVLPGAGSFTVALQSVDIGDEVSAVVSPARVFGAAPDEELGIGARILVSGTISATPPHDEVALLVFAHGPPRILSGAPAGLDWANGLRTGFRGAAAGLPGDGGSLLPGLSIGDTSAVGDELDAAMKTSSLSHLTAVSGDTKTNMGAFEFVDYVRASCGDFGVVLADPFTFRSTDASTPVLFTVGDGTHSISRERRRRLRRRRYRGAPTRFILSGTARACSRWAADRDLHLSEWSYVEPFGDPGLEDDVREFARVKDESQLPPVVLELRTVTAVRRQLAAVERIIGRNIDPDQIDAPTSTQ